MADSIMTLRFGIVLNAHCRSDHKLVHVWIPGAIMFLDIYETTKRCYAILDRWDVSKYKALRNNPLTLAYLMFPFPAIKNVFTNRFVQRAHGYRIYLQDGETSAKDSAGQGLETFYGAPREGSRRVWRHQDVTLRTWVGESPWVLARSTVGVLLFIEILSIFFDFFAVLEETMPCWTKSKAVFGQKEKHLQKNLLEWGTWAHGLGVSKGVFPFRDH